MPQILTSEMARKSFGALLEGVERQEDFSPDEAHELLASCEMGSLVLERLWHLAQGFLDRGMEARKLTFLVKELVDVIELGIKALDTARERVKAAAIAQEKRAEAIAMLELQGRRATEIRDELLALVRWLETPRPAVTPSSLPVDAGDRDAQGYVDLKDLTARLLSVEDA